MKEGSKQMKRENFVLKSKQEATHYSQLSQLMKKRKDSGSHQMIKISLLKGNQYWESLSPRINYQLVGLLSVLKTTVNATVSKYSFSTKEK